MIFSLKIKKNRKRPNSIWKQTIPTKMTKSGITHPAQVARGEKEGRKKRGGGAVGTSPTNHGYTSHDRSVSMHIIFMKNL